MKSMKFRWRSQSPLLAMIALPSEKSRKRLICALMWATFSSIVSTVIILRMSVLPDGSPIIAVPPPISAMGRWPARCMCAIAMIGM